MDGMFFGTPEEVHAALRQRAEEMKLTAEEHTRNLDDFMEGLDEGHLKLLQTIVRQIVHNPEYGQYLNGWLSHMLKSKYNMCQFCGGKHETPEDWIAAHADNLPGVDSPAPWMRGHDDNI
jgi:hypothetical protein